MLELSPEFPGSDIASMVDTLQICGYEVGLVPVKGTPVGGSVLDCLDPFTMPTSQRTLLAHG